MRLFVPVFERTGGAGVALLYAGTVLCLVLFVYRFAFNWIYIDDISLLFWSSWIEQGQAQFLDVFLNAWNNQHPVGTLVALFTLVTKLFGLNFKILNYLSAAVIVASVSLLAWQLSAELKTRYLRALAWLAPLSAACHPTQTQHLLWAFEICWFLINLFVVVNAVVAERLKQRGVVLLVASSLAAMFCSAHGAFAWYGVALQVLLHPQFKRRWFWGAAFGTAGTLSLMLVVYAGRAANSSPLPRFDQLGDFLVYAIRLLGIPIGSRDHSILLVSGAALLLLAIALTVANLRRPLTSSTRIGFTLLVVSMLSLGSFAAGRFYLGIDWATGSFHPGPFFVPFYFGLMALSLSALDNIQTRLPVGATAAGLFLLLFAIGFAHSIPYGAARARVWRMSRGYAMWLTCNDEAPLALQARAAGVSHLVKAFSDIRPSLLRMCASDSSAVYQPLLKMPRLFNSLITAHPSLASPLTTLWQDYATDMILQLSFDVSATDTPRRLIEFAKANAKAGSPYDSDRLKPFEHLFMQM